MWQDGGEVMLCLPVHMCVCGQMGMWVCLLVCLFVFVTEESVLAAQTVCSSVHLFFCMCVWAGLCLGICVTVCVCMCMYVKPCDVPNPFSDRHDSPRK